MNSNFLKNALANWRMKFQGCSQNIKADKLELIDHVFTQCIPAPTSFADLGGVWGVNAAYTFYTFEKHNIQRAFLVDTDFNNAVTEKSRSLKNLALIPGNFGDDSIVRQLGEVDAIYLFDVLLHQVNPDWDQILKNYARHVRYFVVYNQQWIGFEKTVRLLDLGRDEYFKNVPHDPSHETYKNLFDKMHELHPQHRRPWRDIHNVWQWGITDNDLQCVMANLGFKQLHYKNCGKFGNLNNFEDHAFIFQKSS